MDSIEPFIAWLLVAVCFCAALVFAWQQLATLRRLRAEPAMPAEDRTYFRRQAIRRLIGCGLLVGIGGLIAGSYVSGQEAWVAELKSPAPGADKAPPPDPDVQQRKRAYVWYWITVLILLLAVVIVAALDFLAIRNYGARHLRRLYADRKAMLEQELAELRRARGYRNGPP